MSDTFISNMNFMYGRIKRTKVEGQKYFNNVKNSIDLNVFSCLAEMFSSL